MSKFLEAGKYYMVNISDADIGSFQMPFYVAEMNVFNLETGEEHWKIQKDDQFRDEKGFFRDNEFDYEYDLVFPEENVDQGDALNEFELIEDENEIEKAKTAIESFQQYLSDMADKYEAQYC